MLSMKFVNTGRAENSLISKSWVYEKPKSRPDTILNNWVRNNDFNDT